ncbi:type I polyketide synthase [Streptomyces sp. NBC_01012]|uniref:type I polyketide synthase n=1 Tax=Streptomyces sp. NBC_01012 TaxID=2903717 RepID=UPI00386443E3|nr:type I polyketide synthase [Streptomyces sp. NBC_01012]
MTDDKKLLDYLRRATAELGQTKAALREARQAPHEPIAIVGMDCRYPGGVESPEDLWRLVADGTDAITEWPVNRGWDLEGRYDPDPERSGTSYTRNGGFLHEAGLFDAGFFGISPREALSMDPQQRLLLETAWTAVERAGLDPHALRGTKTGVYIGAIDNGYGDRSKDVPELQGLLDTGTADSVVSGRVSYVLGLEGPAVSVNTACSSSLVAIHLAVQALRAGETTMALAGGITVMATLDAYIAFSRQRGLSSDGRCKAFADAADGTGWSEGAGVLVLERLSDAQRNGHQVLGVIRGSAINQDGASNGLSAPNGPSQQRVIKEALDNAQLSPGDIDAVEAHGTGTKLGDPIEAQALLAAYGRHRERPLWLGSLKSNIGHSSAAAGVGGVIKMVMAMRNGTLPKTLHVDTPSRAVDWTAGQVELLTEAREWSDEDGPRRAGVSAFGVSGTNVHTILEEAPAEEPVAGEQAVVPVAPAVVPWVLSGRSAEALRGQAAGLVPLVDEDRAAVGAALAGRSVFEHRAVVVGESAEEFAAALKALAEGEPLAGVVSGVASGTGKTVFVFPGQGSQWAGMAVELLESSPVFAARFEECERALTPLVDWSLTDVVRSGAYDRVDVVQPVLWAVMVSLAALWESAGVRPDAVVGHSQGEIAAAVVAGALSLEDGARVVALRSKAITRLAGGGGMVSVPLPVGEVRSLLPEGVSVAAVNGPSSVVVSGDPAGLEQILGQVERAKRVPVDYSSHSVQVEEIRDEILRVLAEVSPREVTVPFFSTVDVAWADGTGLDAAYWYRNLRQTVEFEAAVQGLDAAGFGTFVEISAHPVLTMGITATVGDDAVVSGTLRRDEGGLRRFLLSVGELFVRGVAVNFTPFLGGTAAYRDLPTYPFQRKWYWLEDSVGMAEAEQNRFWQTVEDGGLSELLGVDPQTPLSEVLPALSDWRNRHDTRTTVDSWRYRVTWKALPGAGSTELSGHVLALVPETGHPLVDEVCRALEAAGATVTRTELTAAASDRRTLARRLADVPRPLDRVVSLVGLDERPHPDHSVVPVGTALTLALVQALEDAGVDAPLWCLTSGAVSTGDDDPVTAVAQNLVWGLGRVAALEYPRRWGGLLDLAAGFDPAALTAALAGDGDEDQIALRPGTAYGRRLERAPLPDGPAPEPWRPRGTVLITGGTGAVGGQIAVWLAGNGAEHLVLLSRRGGDAPGAAELTAELESLGARVTTAACDVTDREQLAALVADLEARGEQIRSVMHTAGAGSLVPLPDTDLAEFGDTLHAKVLGAAHLDELIGEVDAFVLFSSISAVWGSADHGAYAAANAYLDGLAENRRARGLGATSVVWGIWAPQDGKGMAANLAERQLRGRGIPFMRPALAIEGFQQVLDRDETVIVVAAVDWDRFAPVFTSTRPSALISELPDVRAALVGQDTDDAAQDETGSPLLDRLRALPAAEQRELLAELVRAQAAAVLGHESATEIEPGRAFRELGFDSLTAVDLRGRLNAATGLRLPVTVVFDYSSATALADHLRDELLGTGAAPAAPVAVTVPTEDDPVVIVAASCRYPGGVRSPEDLWQLLADGRDAISELPGDRGWDLGEVYDTDPDRPGTTYSRAGGFVYDAGLFDPEFFGISPREALAMDPQQRLLLETSWEALERGGIAPTSLRGTQTGVFVGASYQGYGGDGERVPEEAEGHLIAGISSSVLSGRISYSLGLEGPALTIDTACSSSLVAVHLAAQALRSGECSLALAAGATVLGSTLSFTGFSRQRGLAADGRCKPFGAEADGFGIAEGVGMLVLERLSDARRNGHPVLATVRGSAVNQDGASNGLTAPNGLSQQRVIQQALANSGLRPADVRVVEAHGTGTKLGDPIEAQALLATYGQDRTAPLRLGSLKSNVGHTQAASGVGGIIKMLQAMEHGVLPRTLHADVPSPFIDWSEGNIELLTEARPWEGPRRAGVSSFGMSGTNAHVIIEQVDPVEETADDALDGAAAPAAVAWTLSGRTEQAVRDQAHALLDRLAADPLDVAHSLAATRTAFERRAVVVGTDREHLTAGLRALRDGQAPVHTADAGRRTVFVFPGQGTQWTGMALELLDSAPVFAERFAECERALAPHIDWSLTEVLRSGEYEQVDRIQPVLFSVMVSLAALWRSCGVEPDAVVGHSQGEIAAACVAGALSLEDAAMIVALRSKALTALAGQGAMMFVAMAAEPLRERVAAWDGRIGVAAVNGPTSVTVSGDPEALEELGAALSQEGVMRWPIPGADFAAHSAQVERIHDELMRLLDGVTPRSTTVAFWSSADSAWLDGSALDTAYWYRNLRQTVEFDQAVNQLIAAGYDTFVEVSPNPVLAIWVQQALEAADGGAVVGTLHRESGGLDRFLTSLGELHARGGTVDWTAVHRGGRRVDLPTYPFQRQHYWLVPLPLEPAAPPASEDGDAWQYRVDWRVVHDLPARPATGEWLVVTPEGTDVDGHLDALRRQGLTTLVVPWETADDRATGAARLRAAAEGHTPAGVLSLLGLADRPWSDGTVLPAGLPLTVTLIGALGDAGIDAPLWAATSGAVSIGPADPLAGPAQATLWGLGGVAGVEYPGRWAGLVDLPADFDDRAAQRLLAVLTGESGEDQVAIRPSGVHGRRLAHARGSGFAARPWQPGGTVLVTGGLGALGGHVARWLATAGAEHLLLTGRRGAATPGADALTAELRALGARVTVAACDMADRDAVAELLAGIPAETPLTAVVHAAGVLDDGVVDSITAERAAGVARPKADAALVLHELTRGMDLSAFVLFSSLASTVAGTGQGSYAAANAYLDALALHRRDLGLPATSVSWGLWAGKSLTDEAVAARLVRDGMPAMDPERAVAALRHAVGSGEPHVIVSDFAWDRFVAAFTALRPSPLIADLPEVAALTERAAAPERPAALDRAALLELVRTAAAEALGYENADAIGRDRVFKDLGCDSLTAVELRNKLSAATGLRLPVTLVFDCPTPTAVVDHLVAELGEPEVRTETAVVPAAGAAVTDDAIAIVALACRFPGGIRTPEDFWRLISEGGDAITPFPTDRGWDLDALYDPDPDHHGTTYAREGGFLHDLADFDPAFFGISPREATTIDPQQRLLLETTWEAFERAGIDPQSVKGSRAGVFVGSSYHDYGLRVRNAPEEVEGYLGIGSAGSVASGRISYTFGLEGPAVSVDTACSSSLVAIHLAAQSLRSGECTMALAGGAAAMATPTSFVEFSRQRGLAENGRCKPFAAAADGTAWAEGVGLILLERLSDARRNGHPVLALVRGSAVNQDGASNGLTAPNGPSQQRVIRDALASARLAPAELDVVEAHGTGTKLGDPIEAQALLATYGQDRAQPLLLGSVKSNIGHSQAAAGIAGVIKMVLAMEHGTVPGTLHVDEPSPFIDWSAGSVEVVTENTPWPVTGHPRRAAVSSFGVSGTNAHTILEQAPDDEPATASGALEPLPVPLVLSARSAQALREQADQLDRHLAEHPDVRPADIGYTLATTRAHLEHRAVVPAGDRDAVRAALRSVTGTVPPAEPRVAFLFSGQGSQRLGMGLRLHREFPVFAEAFDAVCAVLDPLLERPLHEVIGAAADSADAELLDRTAYTQPALFAVEVALFRLTEHWGLHPDHLIGHSVGELAAAHVAGVLSLPDAALLVAERARLMQAMRADGAMVSVLAPEETVLPHLAEYGDRVTVAAVNSTVATVIAGDEGAVLEVAAKLAADGRKTKRLRVSHAFHSPHMDGMLEEFRQVAARLAYHPPRIPVVSNVTGDLAGADELRTPDYWVRHVRGAVRFLDGVRALERAGVTAFVEIGPDSSLTALAQDCLEGRAELIPLLHRDRDEAESVTAALGRFHAQVAAPDWERVFEGRDVHRVDLPTYAFQRERYWLDDTSGSGDVTSAGLVATGHPLIGAAVELADADTYVFTSRLSLHSTPWLADHGVFEEALFPATAFLELAVRAADEVGCARVDELSLAAPLALPKDGAAVLQMRVGPQSADGTRTLEVFSRPQDAPADEPWTRHADGVLSPGATPVAAAAEALTEWPPPGAEPIDVTGLYDRFADSGFAYGPVFQGLTAVWRRGDEVFAEAALPASQRSEAGRYGLHPALLDSVLHSLAFGVLSGSGQAWLPFAWSGVTLHAGGAAAVRLRMAPTGDSSMSVALADGTGTPVATAESLALRPAAPARSATGGGRTHRTLFRPEFTEVPLPTADSVPAFEVRDHEPGQDAEAVRRATRRTLAAIREWLGTDRAGAKLVFRTRGAVPLVPADDVPDLAGAAVWGLVRSAQTEHPDRFVLVDHDHDDQTGADIAAARAVAGGEPQLAVREGRAYAYRIARVPVGAADAAPQWERGGTVLVTGGTGAIGAHVSRHLVTEHGVKRLLLTSRSGMAGQNAARLHEELTALGAEVEVASCDVADRDALAALLAAVPSEHPVTAVVHTAGVVQDGIVASITDEQLDFVLRPKVDAVLNLQELTADLDLSAFVVFSSVAGIFGGMGQANYAAANAFLDALSHRRRAQGLPAASLAWGLWANDAGMSGHLDENDFKRIARGGIIAFPPAEGLELFDTALAEDHPVLLPLRLDTKAVQAQGEVPAVLRGLVRATVRRGAADSATAAAEAASLDQRLSGMTDTQRDRALLDLVRDHTATVLGFADAGSVDVDRGLLEVGFDSLTAVELRNRLGTASGLRLPATLLFDYPSCRAIAGYLAAELVPEPTAAGEQPGLAELERLTALLDDERYREELTGRLHDLLAKARAAAGDDSVGERLDAADDDEIFDFIDNELGMS